MKSLNGYRMTLGVFALVGIVGGAIIAAAATANLSSGAWGRLDDYDASGALLWLAFGGSLFNLAGLDERPQHGAAEGEDAVDIRVVHFIPHVCHVGARCDICSHVYEGEVNPVLGVEAQCGTDLRSA